MRSSNLPPRETGQGPGNHETGQNVGVDVMCIASARHDLDSCCCLPFTILL